MQRWLVNPATRSDDPNMHRSPRASGEIDDERSQAEDDCEPIERRERA